MSKRFTVATEIRVLEEDETRCSLDCQHHELHGSAAKCGLYDIWLDRDLCDLLASKKPVRCSECRDEAK